MEPHERIRAALKEKAESVPHIGTVEKLKGFRGPQREQEHVELFAGDIVAVARAQGDKADPVVKMLEKGSRDLSPDSKVTIQADHAFFLLDQLGSVQT